MDCELNSARRRYTLRLGIAMGAYIVTLTVALHFVGTASVKGAPALVLGLLPGLSVTGIFWAFGKLLLEEKDEYQRLLLVRQSLVATGFTLSIATIWGFLENLFLVPHVDAFFIAVLWFVGLGLGSAFNWLTLHKKNGEQDS
jgi:hypothetical protein